MLRFTLWIFLLLTAGLAVFCGPDEPPEPASPPPMTTTPREYPPLTERPTKLYAWQYTDDEPTSPGLGSCSCHLADITTSAKLDCFAGQCTGCLEPVDCERKCWDQWYAYMHSDSPLPPVEFTGF